MMLARLLAMAVVLLSLLASADAGAGPPTDQLRGHVERVLKILDDPALLSDGKAAERRATIRAIAGEIFDFEEISLRSLGRHWQARTTAERKEFVQLFGELLERTYISRIEGYSGEKIAYVGEALDSDQATVRTRIVTKQGTEVPVDYRMLLRGDRWRAFDVTIEGVSLVGNYRTQFNSIIQRASYPELVAKLRAKQDERTDEGATKRRERKVEASTGPAPRRQAP